MPTVRKVAPEIAATWQAPEDEPVPTPADSRGLTRMNYPASGSIGWMARVFHGGATFTRYFSDARHGGPSGALRRAETWRDDLRQRIVQCPKPTPPDQMRLVRTDHPAHKLVGWYAYVRRGGQTWRRYFSDARHGGTRGAHHAAEQWAGEMLGTPTQAPAE